jgi:hypothetical protein
MLRILQHESKAALSWATISAQNKKRSAATSARLQMLVAFLMDHRLALLALVALLVTAAAPLAYAWAGLLPQEPPPFEVNSAPASLLEEPEPSPEATRRTGHAFTIFLLACMTFSYILKFPGLPLSAILRSLATLMPQDYLNWVVMGGRAFFVVLPVLAALYSAIRPNPIRIQLIVGGVLVVALWFVGPVLTAAIAQ